MDIDGKTVRILAFLVNCAVWYGVYVILSTFWSPY